MSAGSFFTVSPQYLTDLSSMHLSTFCHHTAADAAPCRLLPGSRREEKGASSGRKRRNTRQPTSLAAVVTCISLRRGGRRKGGGAGCGEPRSNDEPSQVAALLPHSQLLLPSVPSRPLHSHHHVLYRFDSSLSLSDVTSILNSFQRLLPSWQEMTSSKRR